MVQFNDIFRQPQRQYQQRQGRDNVCPNSSFGPARIVLLAVILAAVLTLIFTALRRKNREGLFPASACIKLTGVFDTTGETLVVRHCALDSGSLTQDTELARMSHCGKFQFEGDLLRGCVLACPEDGCNGAHSSLGFMNKMPLYVLWLVLISVFLAN